MIPEQLEKILSGKISFPLRPEDYCRVLGEGGEKDAIERTTVRIRRYLHFLGTIYPINEVAPDVLLDPITAVAAKVRISRAGTPQIIVSRGLLDHLAQLGGHPLLITIEDELIILDADDVRDLATFWIVAHEYFHYARGHLLFPKSDHELYPWGFEYDADNLATAALYRWATEIWDTGSFTKKEYCFLSIYWCMRTLSDASGPRTTRATHPEWQERLLMAHFKLAGLGYPRPDLGAQTEEQVLEEDRLTHFFVACEELFLWKDGANTSALWEWLNEFKGSSRGHDQNAATQWEALVNKVPIYDLIDWNVRYHKRHN